MQPDTFGKGLTYLFRALLLVLVMAGVARVAYWLLAPLVPFLVATVALGVVYWVIFRGFRRR